MKNRVLLSWRGGLFAALVVAAASWTAPVVGQTAKNNVVLVSVTLPAASAQVCLTAQGQSLGCIPVPPEAITLTLQLTAASDRTVVAGTALVASCTDGARLSVVANADGFLRVVIQAQGATVHDTGFIPLARDTDASVGSCKGTT